MGNNNCNNVTVNVNINLNDADYKSWLVDHVKEHNPTLKDVETISGFIDQTENSRIESSTTSGRKYSKPYSNVQELKAVVAQHIKDKHKTS